jgi:hypothetical protein
MVKDNAKAALRHAGLARDGAALAGAPRNGLPGSKPYRYRDPDAAREAEVQAILARVRAQAAEEADPGESYEFRREALLEMAEPAPLRLVPDPEPEPAVAEPRPRCGHCGYVVARCCCEPVAAPVTAKPPGRCGRCGYLVTRCCCPGGPRS